MSITALDTTDLLLVFRRLRSDEMRALLASTHNGPLYQEDIDRIGERLEAEADTSPPLAGELRAEDTRHDAFGLFLLLHLESYMALSSVPEFAEIAAVATALQATTVDSRSRLSAGYGEQAAYTARLERRIDGQLDDLRRFPVAGGRDLVDMVRLFIGSGSNMGELLGQRADILVERAQQKEDGGRNVRAQAIVLLGELRGQIQNEIRRRADLPGDVEGRLFGLLDERIARRAERARSGVSSAPAAPGAEGKPSVDAPPA